VLGLLGLCGSLVWRWFERGFEGDAEQWGGCDGVEVSERVGGGLVALWGLLGEQLEDEGAKRW
jgi:hypothetical protein